MTAKCVGCGLDWNVSIYQKIPPHRLHLLAL